MQNNLKRMRDAGFAPLLPLIPVGAQLHPGGEVQDHHGPYWRNATELQPNEFGKTPGELCQGRWVRRPNWTNYPATDHEIVTCDEQGASAGVLAGRPFIGFDSDATDPELSTALWQYTIKRFPNAQFRFGKHPKFMCIARLAEGETLRKRSVKLIKDGNKQGIELIGEGAQFVVAGDHPATGQPYAWYDASGQPVAPDASVCPVLTADEAEAVFAEMVQVAQSLGWEVAAGRSRDREGGPDLLAEYRADPALFRDMMAILPNDVADYHDWIATAYAIKWQAGDEEGWPLFDAWSRKCPDYDKDAKTASTWRGLGEPDGSANIGKIRAKLGDGLPSDLLARWKSDYQRRNAQMHVDNMPPPPTMPPGMFIATVPGVPITDPTPEQLSEMALEIEGAYLMDPVIIKRAAVYKSANDPRYGMMEERARGSCLTDFRKAVKTLLRAENFERIKQKEATADVPRQFYDVTNPNSFVDIAEDIERRAGEAEMGFVFGGNAVVLRKMQSAYGHIVQRDENGNKIKGADPEPAYNTQAVLVRSPHIRRMAAKLGYYSRQTEEVEVAADLPGTLVQQFEAIAGDTWKPMLGMVQHPVMFEGELLFGDDEFHHPSGLFLQTGTLDVMRWNDPEAAYKFLTDEWLGDFAFETELDKAKALMMPATLLVAKTDLISQPGPPIFLDTAPFPGTGKSLKTSVCHAAITGVPAPTTIYPDQKEEREKIITAAIMEGQSHLAFDNLKTGSTMGNSHAELAALTTSPQYKGRILGKSAMFEGPAGIVISANGNNVIAVQDMASRVVEVRHNPPANQNLAQRKFKRPNLMQWTLNNRGKIIGALACLMARRSTGETVGRFPVWSQVVADPILSVAKVDGFYGPWIDAGEPETVSAGSHSFGELLMYLKPLMGGEWRGPNYVTALINGAPSIRLSVFNTEKTVSTETVVSYLRRHAGWKINDAVLHMQRFNLGDETGRKERWCALIA